MHISLSQEFNHIFPRLFLFKAYELSDVKMRLQSHLGASLERLHMKVCMQLQD